MAGGGRVRVMRAEVRREAAAGSVQCSVSAASYSESRRNCSVQPFAGCGRGVEVRGQDIITSAAAAGTSWTLRWLCGQSTV
jgi:hypothetical protein